MHPSCCGRGLERCTHMLAAVLVVLYVQSGSGPLAVGAEMEVLSPRNRELFARLPLPVLVRIHGAESSDPDVSFSLEVDGAQVYSAPASLVIETELAELEEGPHECTFITFRGEGEVVESVALNISVRTDTDENDLIYYIPPKDAARPRVFHWLVSTRADEPAVPDDLARRYPTLFYPPNADELGGGRPGTEFGRGSEAMRQMQEWARKQNEVYRTPQVVDHAQKGGGGEEGGKFVVRLDMEGLVCTQTMHNRVCRKSLPPGVR